VIAALVALCTAGIAARKPRSTAGAGWPMKVRDFGSARNIPDDPEGNRWPSPRRFFA